MANQDLLNKRVRVVRATDLDGKPVKGITGTIVHIDAQGTDLKCPFEFKPEVQDRGEWRESGRWMWLSADSVFEVL